MKFSLVMTNWNGKNLLQTTLPTLLEAAYYNKENSYEIILVDDSSTDGSVKYVKDNFSSIAVYSTRENIGSIAAANFGVSKASAPYVMLLNSDMKLSPDAVKLMASHMERQDVFAVTPAVFDWEGNFQYGNRGGQFRMGHFSQYEKPVDETKTSTLFACGGAFLFKKQIWDELGGYDNELFYPYYYEEIDISYRALKRGYQIIYEKDANVFHKIRGSIFKDRHFHEIRTISGRNNYLFSWKNITDPDKVIAMCIFNPLFLLRDLFLLRFRFWKCYFRALRLKKLALKKREEEKKHFKLTDKEIFKMVNGE